LAQVCSGTEAYCSLLKHTMTLQPFILSLIVLFGFGHADASFLAPNTTSSSSSDESDIPSLTLLGSSTAQKRTELEQQPLEDPVRQFYHGLASAVQPAATAPVAAQARPAQAPLDPASAAGAASSGVAAAPTSVPVTRVLPESSSSNTGATVRAKMGELSSALNGVLQQLNQQTEQLNQHVEKLTQEAQAKEQMVAQLTQDKEQQALQLRQGEQQIQQLQEKVQSLTTETERLSDQLGQAQQEKQGMVEEAKTLSSDLQARLQSWITKYATTTR